MCHFFRYGCRFSIEQKRMQEIYFGEAEKGRKKGKREEKGKRKRRKGKGRKGEERRGNACFPFTFLRNFF